MTFPIIARKLLVKYVQILSRWLWKLYFCHDAETIKVFILGFVLSDCDTKTREWWRWSSGWGMLNERIRSCYGLDQAYVEDIFSFMGLIQLDLCPVESHLSKQRVMLAWEPALIFISMNHYLTQDSIYHPIKERATLL